MVKVGWRSKAMYVLFALALVFGLSVALVPTQQVARAEVPDAGTFAITGTGGEISTEQGYTDPVTGLTYDYVAGYFVGTNNGIPVGPYYAQMSAATTTPNDPNIGTFYNDIQIKMYIDTNRIDFVGYVTSGSIATQTVNVGIGTLTIENPMDNPQLNPWDYNPSNISLGYSGTMNGGIQGLFNVTMNGQIGVPQLVPEFALDVKTSIQKYILVNVPLFDISRNVDGNITGWEPKGLMAQEFITLIENQGLQSALEDVQGWENVWQIVDWKVLSGVNSPVADIVAGGLGSADSDWNWPDNVFYGDSFIEIRSMEPGDVHVAVDLLWPYNGSYGDVTAGVTEEAEYEIAGAEKKWGVIDKTILDLEPEITWWQPDHPEGMSPFDDPANPNGDVLNKAGSTSYPAYQWFSDFVYAWYYSGNLLQKDVDRAGHATVYWWLIEDDEGGINEKAILDIMDFLNTYDGDGVGGPDAVTLPGLPLPSQPSGLGKYALPPKPSPKDMIQSVYDGVRLTDNDLGIDLIPTSALGDPNLNGADFTVFNDTVDGFYYLDNQGTYLETVTQGDFPFETRGLSMVEVKNTGPESMLVVTLAEYPTSKHGENAVSVEMGKKRWGPVPEIEEVKTPQLRWAGEKVVLEKDWFDIIGSGESTNGGDYVAVYHLEEQSVGEISIANDDFNLSGSVEKSEGDIWVPVNYGVNGTDSVSAVILESEVQGEADVNVKLYSAYFGWNEAIDGPGGLVITLIGPPIVNYGFVVYFMAFEDVVLAEDVTPQESLEGLNPNQVDPAAPPGDPADVAVQVRGWFTSEALAGTNRQAELSSDGITYDRPAGRYVMPDDWWALAGNNFDLRSNFDLMDQANMDSIADSSGNLDGLGPYGPGVWTTLDPQVAQRPTIGPFSILQEWSNSLMWIAQPKPPTSHDGYGQRNTVVPDGKMTWYDAPMPEALVIFDVQDGSASDAMLMGLLKTNLGPKAGMDKGYGYTGIPKVFESPFYQTEIPSHPVIPALDYDWDSWNDALADPQGNPYPFWMDLTKKSLDDVEAGIGTPVFDINPKDLEVYSDNHGIAAVTIEALNEGGTVTLVATAEYPAALKRGKYGPTSSAPIPVQWGAVELNPHFQADKTDVAVEEVVTFTNLTAGGTIPYTTAKWDFDADGVFETIIEGTHAQVMAPVTWAYSEPFVYTVRLWMTDSTPTTRFEERTFYITVADAPPTTTWDMPFGTDEDGAAVNQYKFPNDAQAVTLADANILVSIPADVSIIWYYAGTGPGEGWQWFAPIASGDSTLLTLEPGKSYNAIATTATSWDIPQPQP